MIFLLDTEVALFEEYLEKCGLKNEVELDVQRSTNSLNFLNLNQNMNNHEQSATPIAIRKEHRVKLPKLSVKSCNGDPIIWPQFIDTFNNAVDENSELTEIEKFSYLKSYLTGDAEKAVEGLSLTAENFVQGMTILKDRFGNKQLIISKHMNALLALDKVRSSFHIRELRSVYDKVVVNLRALRAYDIHSKHFGPMLIPVILEKLPADIKLEISRKMGVNEWELDIMMDILKVEIEARETCNINGIGRGFPKENGGERKFVNFHHPKAKGFTTEQLLININLKVFSVKCVFCRQDHYSDKCPVVTNIDSRKEIVRNNRLCFKCLGLSHFVQNCKK